MATADRIAAEHAGERVSFVTPIRGGEGRAAQVRDELVRELVSLALRLYETNERGKSGE